MFKTNHPAPVQSEDIGVGTLLWYKGFTSQGSWDCPAIIYRTSPKCRNFYVMSLDDMREQHQQYEIDLSDNPHSPNSCQNMRLASVAEVDAYLVSCGSTKTAAQIISEVQAAAQKHEAA
jgi:hypothetical protein